MKRHDFISKIIVFFCVISLLVTAGASSVTVSAAKKVALNKKKACVTVGKTIKLKLKNAKKKVRWFSSNRKVASVNQKGLVRAKKSGTTKITARCGKKKYKCSITVKSKSTGSGGGNAASSSKPSATSTPKISSTPKPSATVKPSSKPLPTATSSNNQSVVVPDMPSSPSNSLTVGKMMVTLGMSKDEVVSSIGATPDRQELAPQGFDVYVFNPSGDYTNYMNVYFSGDKVVGMSTISKYFSYESIVFSGDSIDTLESRGFVGLGYSYTAAYKIATVSANILAYTDYQGGTGTYGIQVFSSDYSLDDMLRPQKCTYTSDIVAGTLQQMPEWVNAFRRYKGLGTLCTVQGNTAQAHSDNMVETGDVESTDPDGTTLSSRMYALYGDEIGYGENNGKGCADAFGYISYWIDDRTSSMAAGTNYTRAYNNLILYSDEYGLISPYYICAGFSYNLKKSTYITYGVLDFYYY